MRSLLLMSAFLVASCLLLGEEQSKIVRVLPEYRAADSFERISEYFGGQEKHPGRTVLRSQPDERGGYYFLVRLKNAKHLDTAKTWQLQILPAGSDKVLTFSFPFDPKNTRDVTELGLTGSDWKDPKASPNAWRIAVLDDAGRVLLSSQSFLWR